MGAFEKIEGHVWRGRVVAEMEQCYVKRNVFVKLSV